MFRTMHKLTKTFTDTGPRNVAERQRNKMEKFKAHLPLLNVICNAGIRDRHWDQVGAFCLFSMPPQVFGMNFQMDLRQFAHLLLRRVFCSTCTTQPTHEYTDHIDKMSVVINLCCVMQFINTSMFYKLLISVLYHCDWVESRFLEEELYKFSELMNK